MSSSAVITSDQLVSLVYVSSGIREFDDLEIAKLLVQARLKNKRWDLTGMLVYHGGNFLQVLEGPNAHVETTLLRIRRDPRHFGVMVMNKAVIQTRNFSEWTMAFKRLSAEALREVEGYSPFMEQGFTSDEFRAQTDFASRMLMQFKDKMR